MHGRWLNKNGKCNDSKELFEAIVPRLDSYVKEIGLVFSDKHMDLTKIDAKSFAKYATPFDTFWGRCYTVTFPSFWTQKGILDLKFYGEREVTFYFHSFGTFSAPGKTSVSLHQGIFTQVFF